MSKWSDGANLLQKIITAKEVVPIQNDLINLQQLMFGLQTEQMKLMDENAELKNKIEKLSKKEKYHYEEGHKWLIKSDRPNLKLCPTCLNRDAFESPLSDSYDDVYLYCGNCKNSVN